MESRIQKTLENHRKGYNCAQSVACAYCDLVGLDEQSVFRATEAFGLGMGGMQATLRRGIRRSDAGGTEEQLR